MAIAVLTISRGEPRIEYVFGYGQLNRHQDITTFLMPASMYVDTQRNMLLSTARAHGPYDWYVFIDDDIGFEVDQVRALCATEHPVVTGIYRSLWPGEGYFPVLYDIADGEFPHVPMSRVEGTEPVQVDVCGAGFLAIRSDVVDAMPPLYGEIMPWFDEPIAYGKKLGEDFGFCLRLADMGIPIFALPTVIVKHHKVVVL